MCHSSGELTGVRLSEKTVSEDYILCGSICMTFQKEKKTNYSFKKQMSGCQLWGQEGSGQRRRAQCCDETVLCLDCDGGYTNQCTC